MQITLERFYIILHKYQLKKKPIQKKKKLYIYKCKNPQKVFLKFHVMLPKAIRPPSNKCLQTYESLQATVK